MFHYLYKITNNINGKIYVGVHSTEDMNDGYMGSGDLILKAIDKYGVDNLNKDILFQFDDRESAFMCESEIVDDEFVRRKDTYNLNVGGNAPPSARGRTPWNKGSVMPDGVKNKISESVKGVNNHFYGKSHTDESRRKMSDSHKGEIPWNRGIPHSEESRKKMSERAKGRVHSDEAKRKMSEARKGVVFAKVECPYCGKIGGGSSMKRYHFDNCKDKGKS